MQDDNTPPRRLTLPPPYRPHWLASGDAFEAACRLAPQEGAGTLVWHASSGGNRAGRFEFAVVLEPETPLADARRAHVAGMAALADALAAHAPPERAVAFRWPGAVDFDGGHLGGMRFAAAPGAGEADVPPWMVLGVALTADRDHLAMPERAPGAVSLKEEGFADPPAILESFAAYLMLHFDRWAHDGFAPVAAFYAGRLQGGGVVTEAGDLLRDGVTENLTQALRAAP